jgi:magnesium-transporting ATPase (P-type)
MNPTLMIGTRVVILALIFYSIGILIEQRKHLIINNVLIFVTIGIILDVTATIFMIMGSPNAPFTLHGCLGYSALAAMLFDTILIWRFRIVYGARTKVNIQLHLYSRFAYLWWLVAFITGSLLVFLK